MPQRSRDEKLQDATTAHQEIWEFLQNLDEYKKDLDKGLTEEEALQKWSFYPIGDRDNSEAYFALFIYLAKNFGVNDFCKSVHLKKPHESILRFTAEDMKRSNDPRRKIKMPDKLVIEVDNYQSVSTLVNEFKFIINNLYGLFGVNPAPAESEIESSAHYMVEKLRALDYSDKEIVKRLCLDALEGSREAKEKQIRRILKQK